MAELIQAYDSYNEFERDAYFVISFDTIPSRLRMEAPLKANKGHMEKVLELLKFEQQGLEIVFKHWTTDDSNNADHSKDYPYEYLYKSRGKHLLVWLTLQHGELEVEFLYDQADTELEAWVIHTNHQLRTTFGISQAPVFKVLSRDKHSFFTEDVRTDHFNQDVSRYYNDDFREVDEIILKSLSTDKAGLILLHGTPGTGKTSYIKSLITRFEEKSFIFIQNEFVNELLHPEFISFMLKHRNAILIIEDAEKVLTSREGVNENSVVSTILQLTDGLFSDYLNIKIICTFNTSINRIDKALLRKGRMIAYYEFKPLSSRKANELMLGLGLETMGEEMTLADIFNYQDKGFRQENHRQIGFQN
ncbi:MAG: AAA family ATPase [Saprospiraceae bacterium]|nr:AAA family ATPase [Lewinella sp.]